MEPTTFVTELIPRRTGRVSRAGRTDAGGGSAAHAGAQPAWEARWPAATGRVTAASSSSTAALRRLCAAGPVLLWRREAWADADRQRVASTRSRRPDVTRALDLRDEDGDPAAREGNPPVRIAETVGDAQLDRAPGPRDRRPAGGDRCRAAARGFRSGSPWAGSRRRISRNLRAARRAGGRRGDRAQPLCPNVEEAPESRRSRRRLPGATSQAALRQLPPATWDIGGSARAVVAAGADGLSLVNTIRGLVLDPRTLRPVLAPRPSAGIPVPRCKPIALACVRRARRRSTCRSSAGRGH